MFYVTSLICLSAAFLGFVDYSVLDMLVREKKIIPQLKLDLAYQLGDESLQIWIYSKLLVGLVQFYSMFELADFVLIDRALPSTNKSLRNKVLVYVGIVATLVLTAYLFIAIWMGMSTHDYTQCSTVYRLTESFTAALFVVISISLTIAYLRLRKAIDSCAFSFDKGTTQHIAILFRFLVTSFLLQTAYLIFWAIFTPKTPK